MAGKLIRTMDLPGSVSRIFDSRSLYSAKDVLYKTELDLMELLDIPSPELSRALDRIHACVCPPHRSLAEHVLVLHPSSMSDLMRSLQGLEKAMTENSVCLVIVDSVATLLQSDAGIDLVQRQEILGQQASLLKFLAESFRIPVVVTNQVRSKGSNQWSEKSRTALPPDIQDCGINAEDATDEGLTAALGTKWAHSVNIRLLLESSFSGQCNIKIVKSPMSACATFPYHVTSKGLELQNILPGSNFE